jgi:hypothetical protein
LGREREERRSGKNHAIVCGVDDDVFYLFLKKQQLASRYIPTGELPMEIKESTCDDATIKSLIVP